MKAEKREEFIEKARKVHGDKYDYSKVEYINSKTKVCIICPEHGEFWQCPYAHLRGNSCPECANVKRGDTFRFDEEKFIERAKQVHGDKYDYSKVVYKNADTKVCVICPEHGEFWTRPVNHIYRQKQGCPKCAGRGLSTDEVLERFRKVHGDKYDYSKVVFNKMHEKVCIICPEHGEFWQTPAKHINGQGCRKCGIIDRSERRMKSTEQFINESIKVHGNKYDYGKAVYKGAFKKVCIICPEHGEFWQRAFDHIHGHGCPACCQSLLEKEVELLLINNNIKYELGKHFIWLGKQHLDFYLPEYNVAIECQGEQHFRPIEYFGGDEGYKVIKERDERKRKLLAENNIKIIYYSNIDGYGCVTDKNILLKNIFNE